MVRLMQIAGVLSLVLAAGVLTLCIRQWSQTKAGNDFASALSAATSASLSDARRTRAGRPSDSSPLVTAAQTLGAYLKPPPAPETPAVQEAGVVQAAPVPAVQPPANTPKFTLRGTIFCADQPQRSLALVCEPGAKDGGRWVRQGTQLGHFVIEKVRPGSVICRAGERVCEMAVEREAERQFAAASDRRTTAMQTGPTANHARPAAPTSSPKRPRGNTRMAVGSPRTAALSASTER
jgi:hypothetical protein